MGWSSWRLLKYRRGCIVWKKEEMVSKWQENLNVHYGMNQEQALENFRAWREKKKTCIRCEGEKYVDYCEIKTICKEANEDERDNVTGNADRGRNVEVTKYKALRTNESKTRQRTSLR
jgi:hypothetical protein